MGEPQTHQPVNQGGQAARRVGVNAVSLMTGDVLNRGTTFAIYALVARYCGAYSFGQLSLGLMLLYAFQVLASVGLPTLIFRDVAKQPHLNAKYLLNACAIVIVTFMICYALLALFAVASGYAAGTIHVILLLGLSILPWSLSLIAEAIFRAHERMYLILWAAVPVSIVKLGLAYYLLERGFGVVAVAILLFGSHVAICVVQSAMLVSMLRSPLAAFDRRFCRRMLANAWRFFGIDALIAIWASVNVILLSWFSGEVAVGVFGAAAQLLIPPGIVLQAVVTSLFPIMCRRADHDRISFRQLTLMMFEVLMFIALPGCVLLWFFAESLISLIFDSPGLAESATLVRVMLGSLVLSAITRLLGQVLMSHGRESVNLRIVAIDVVFNVVCGAVLIFAFGVIGAAVSLLLTHLLDCVLHYLMSRDLLANASRAPAAGKFVIVRHTFVSAGAMAVALWSLGDIALLWAGIVGSTVFVATFALLCCASRGGAIAFRERFLLPLLESTP